MFTLAATYAHFDGFNETKVTRHTTTCMMNLHCIQAEESRGVQIRGLKKPEKPLGV